MGVISARVDDNLKQQAEKIANSIGVSLSTAINIFLTRFIAEEGFPFNVTVPSKAQPVFQKDDLETLLNELIKKNNSENLSSSYLDPSDGQIKNTL